MKDLASIQRLKKIMIGVWVFAALSFLPPFSGFTIAPLGRNLAGLLLVVHAIECVVFLGTLRASGRPLLGELGQTMLFGVIHYRQLKMIEEGSEPR